MYSIEIELGKLKFQRLSALARLVLNIFNLFSHTWIISLEIISTHLISKRILDYLINNFIFSNQFSQLPAPIALFHARENGDLVPICIQLKQEPGPDNPVIVLYSFNLFEINHEPTKS